MQNIETDNNNHNHIQLRNFKNQFYHLNSVEMPNVDTIKAEDIIKSSENKKDRFIRTSKFNTNFIKEMYFEKILLANNNDKFKILKAALPKECGTIELTITRKATGFIKLLPKYYLYTSSGLMLLNSK